MDMQSMLLRNCRIVRPPPRSSPRSRMNFSITIPHILPNDWTAAAAYRSVPSEETILKHDYGEKREVPEDLLTGVNMAALAYAASQVLSLSEVPTVTFENRGSWNALYCLEFPQHNRRLLARIPLNNGSSSGAQLRLESAVATMCFARCIRHIPAPQVFAWNAGYDHPIATPFIIQEYVDNVIEPWQGWNSATDSARSRILNELARLHAALLAPLPEPLHARGVMGKLVFAPGVSRTAPLSDPTTYAIQPLKILLTQSSLVQQQTFNASSVSLENVWDQLWLRQYERCFSAGGSQVNRETLGLDDDDDEQNTNNSDERCDVASLTRTSNQVREFSTHAQRLLTPAGAPSPFPSYASSCLVHTDYAFRNVLIDPHTHSVRALIDWDDVHVMPFLLGVGFPEDIGMVSSFGLPPDAEYFREGAFRSFPADEYGNIVGAVGPDGELTGMDTDGKSTGVDQRDDRIRNTRLREEYLKALRSYDERVGQPEMWEQRRMVLKAYCLLTGGGSMWWDKRHWLDREMRSFSV